MPKKIKIKARKFEHTKDFDMVLQYYHSGNFRKAEEICSRILLKDGNNHNALHLMGLLSAHSGLYDDAIDYISKAVILNPGSYEYCRSLGLAFKYKGLLDEAIESFKEAVRLKADCAEAYFYLGNLFEDKGLFDMAADNYRKVLSLNPFSCEAYNNLGFVMEKQGCFNEAIEHYEKAVKLKPDSADGYNNLGNALAQKGLIDEAIESFKEAVRLRPDFAEAFNSLAGAYRDKGMPEEGVKNLKKALLLKPDYADAYNNLGLTLSDQGITDEAIENYMKALLMNSDDAETHANLGMTYLLSKDFERGWDEYEWTLRYTKVPVLRRPAWDGDPLNGRIILVYAVYGYGDTLQFARYLPALYEEFKARKVMFIPQRGLEQLLRESDLKAEILDAETPVETLEFDTNIHLLSLPRIFRTDLENMPFKQKRYLKVNPEKASWYRERFFNFEIRNSKFEFLKIGIFWQGNPALRPDRNRSMPLSFFYPLCRLEGVKTYSLQKGYGIEQLRGVPGDIEITNLGETFNDFSDTAAAIENLDLVITIDTAVAHLSAALGKKTWILLPSHAEWRWHLDMDDSPWYEDVKLFRHKEPGRKDWEEMMEKVVRQVEEEIKDR